MKKIGIILMIIGIMIAAFPFVKNSYQEYHNQQIVKQLEKTQIESNKTKDFADKSNEPNSAQNQNSTEKWASYLRDKYQSYVGADDIMNSNRPQDNLLLLYFEAPDLAVSEDGLTYLGTIEIPSIDLNMPLVEGTEDSDIAISAGHMTPTAYPGQIGNCVIVGHRGYSFGRLFNRLDELGIGDEIIVNVGENSYTYEVYLTKVVLPTDTSVTNQTNQAKVLTLSTCTPLFSSDYRLIVHAKIK